MTRTLIVGDVHGCVEELSELLDAAALKADDRVISVGDLIGKGPDGAAAIRLFRERDYEMLRGNHEEKVLKRRAQGRLDKLPPSDRADAAALCDDDWQWLQAAPLSIQVGDELVVHAGICPNTPLRAQQPAMLMNIRSVDEAGHCSTKIEGTPWARVHEGPPFIYFGHDAVRGLQQERWALGLDTGCVYGGALTGVLLPERRLVQVPAKSIYCEPKKGL